MENTYIKSLMSVGLGEVEAKLYLTLLQDKMLNPTELAKRAGLKRTTCYQYIEELLKKEIIHRTPKGKKFYFVPIEPKKLFSKFKTKVEELGEITPEMQLIYKNSSQRPNITFHEGKSGIREIYIDSFKTVGDAYSIFPADEYFKQFSFDEFTKNEQIIKETKFKSKDLIGSTKNYRQIDQFLKNLNNASKIYKKLPEDFKTSVDILIYGNKTALISLRNMSAIVIENNEIADLFVNIHKYLWKTS